MLQTSLLDAAAFTFLPTHPSANPADETPSVQPEPSQNGSFETLSHVLFGNPSAVKLTIQDLHRRRYAEPNDWSKLLPTGRPNEVMAILTRRVRVE